MKLNDLFNWTDDVILNMTQGELCRKLLDVNKMELDRVIDSYIAHKQADKLDELPEGRLKARWIMRKSEEENETREEDVKAYINTLAVLDRIKKEAH